MIGFKEDLRKHLAVCDELLQLVRRQNQLLKEENPPSPFETHQARKDILPQLNASLAALKMRQREWNQLQPADRARRTEDLALIRANQELIMRILVLDRENEQLLLRRGLLPSKHIPPAARQRPHFVADLYRRRA